MAVESFFVIETSFSDLREKLKEEEEAYIEEEEKAKLQVNIKHESATPPSVITAFREKLLSLGFCENMK